MSEQEVVLEKIDSLDVVEIMKLIPHRHPFLLIDRVKDITPGEKAVGVKNITINENFFPGHFPAQPIMPGVLLVEAMAQTAGVTVMAGQSGNEIGIEPIVYFMTINSARFRKPVVPGDQLEIKANLVKVRGNKLATAEVTCLVAGQVVSSASLMFAITDAAES